MEKTKKNKSILKAIDLLEELSKSSEAISLTELSKRANLPPSTTYRLLDTLASRNYVNKKDGLYQLGQGVVRLQALSKRDIKLDRIARPFLIELEERTGLTTILAIRFGLKATPIEIIKGSARLIVNSNLGEQIPLYAPSVGKSLLAFLPNGEREKIIEELDMEKLTPNTITKKDELRKELEKVKKREYAIDQEEYAEGVCCVGTPILDKEGKAIAAISVAGPVSQVNSETIRTLASDLKDVTNRISFRLYGLDKI